MKYSAIIMAGGSGERFWPLSRVKKPKQLLELSGSGKNLLQDSIARVDGVIDKEDIFIITSESLQNAIRKALPELPPENVIAEPEKRNTAPCLALGASFISQKYAAQGLKENEIAMAVLTADHLIEPDDKFRQTVDLALETASKGKDIITIGIQPTRVETGYGYIEVDSPFAETENVKQVRAFREKPNRETAEEYLASGRYYWNSGMFFFRLDAFIENMILLLPEIGTKIYEMRDKYKALTDKALEGPNTGIADIFSKFPSLSIDYGLMEKATHVSVVKADFNWDDIGSWTALERTRDTDENMNIIEGSNINIDTSNSIIINRNKNLTVAALGLEDMIVVATDDSLLICPKNRAQDVKKVVAKLKENNLENLL